MKIYNGLYDWAENKSWSGGQEITGADKTDKGAVTVANLNDTDGDGTIDRDDNDVSVAGPNPPGRNEIDLMKIVLVKPVPDDGGNVTLKNLGETVKIWEDSRKRTEVPLVGGQKEYATTQLPKTLYVEALNPTFGLRQIILQLEYKGTTDTVKATAVHVLKTAQSPWHTRQAADGFPNNPEPGAGKDLPDLTKASVLTFINDDAPLGLRAADGSRYGFGTFEADSGSDIRIGGRILYEFQTIPSGIEALGFVFDITRQVEREHYVIANGTGDLSNFDEEKFPWLDTPKKDNELPNDDKRESDEDNTPRNLLIYSFDSPGQKLSVIGNTAFLILRLTFKEWVRVQVNNTAFQGEPNHETVQGSRVSPKYDWHLLVYLKRDSSGKWVEDNDDTSFNIPIFTGTGNGTINVTLLADAVREGFTATYDLANLKWTLMGTSEDSDSDAKAAAPAGTKWTMTIGTKIKVEITQGATAFANGDKFVFSVFKTSATGGKKNEIDEGYIDAADGP